jgi:Protein of unknown function/Domain of unknown function (DUF1835)
MMSSVHLVFTPSAAGELRKALAEAGRTDRVICPFDDLSFGPINPPDPQMRRKWVADVLGYSGWEEVIGDTEPFWRESLSAREPKVAWVSRRTAQEYTGFLEWLWRLGDTPFEVVDLTDVKIAGRDRNGNATQPALAASIALLHSYQILDNGLLDRAETLPTAAREQCLELWRRLRVENAPLRVINEAGLASAPISYFDSLLLSYATRDWKKAAMVVGKTLGTFWDDALFQTGDIVLASRVAALVADGVLEARGDPFDLRHSEVRLAAGA